MTNRLHVDAHTYIEFWNGKPKKMVWLPCHPPLPYEHPNWLVESGNQILMACGFLGQISEVIWSGTYGSNIYTGNVSGVAVIKEPRKKKVRR